MSEQFSRHHAVKRAAELRAFAKEYENYSRTMPTDQFALRWQIISEALNFQAQSFANEIAANEGWEE